MAEQTAILAEDHNEWILITDDDEPEKTWKDFDSAIAAVQREGWEIVQGPAPIRSSFAELQGVGRNRSSAF
jgi:hypothetical protein